MIMAAQVWGLFFTAALLRARHTNRKTTTPDDGNLRDLSAPAERSRSRPQRQPATFTTGVATEYC